MLTAQPCPHSWEGLGAMMRFWSKTSGAVAPMFGILVIPVMLCIGLAVDYARQIRVQAQVQAIADAGAVTAVIDEKNAKTEAELMREAKLLLAANIGIEPKDIGLDFDVKVTIDKTTSRRVSTINFTGRLPTTFMRLAGVDTVPIKGKATALSGLPPDTDFYFFLDVSDSMGLAATAAARETMKIQSKLNGGETCEFACHILRGGKKTLLEVARANGVKLRIDVAKDGIKSIVSMAHDAAVKDNVTNRYAMTVFANAISTLSGLTADATAFRSTVDSVELGAGASGVLANTKWEKVAPAYVTELSKLTTAGADPNADKIVVLVTDGLRSQDGGSGKDTYGRPYIRPFDLDQCEAIKAAGYKLAVVYTMYYDIPYNSWYNTYVKPIRAKLQTNLQACATPGLFAVGDTPAEIQKAFETIFKATRARPQITS